MVLVCHDEFPFYYVGYGDTYTYFEPGSDMVRFVF